ncbi:ComEC/Rec2 family competence protein [Chryseobacterium indologenes]|uniref:ComEC/Rec2 family competence protein n=1 Tax=Chryseobacterium indologenes TaxID=253 RepID=UPI001E2BADCF|nr:ComEC/Rec2 family competence protein [Chryseobacterium indologenes]
MNKQPLLILVICFILGIIFQDLMLLDITWCYPIAAVAFGILIVLFFQSYFLHKVRSIFLGLLFFGTGMILHFCNTSLSGKETVIKGKETIVFRISQKLNSIEKYKKYTGIIKAGNENFQSILYIPRNNPELDFTHYYKAEAFIIQPQSPQYDFQFDYARYLKRRDVDYQAFISKEISSVERKDIGLTDRIRQRRLEVLQKIDQSGMSARTREFLKGIILADRTEIDPGTVEDFNKSGLVHLLAISGTHIVVIFGIFYFLAGRFIPLRFRRYVVILSLVFIWLFAAFIGFGNSVLRACIMLSVYFTFVLLQRKPDLLHSLALSAFVILIPDTQQFFDVGFQLSYLAVLGIFWLNQPLLKYFPNQDNYFKKLMFNTITISLSAQLATLPLVLYYFHQFSWVSIIANFLIVPFSEVIIVFSLVMTIFIALRIDFYMISNVYDFVIRVLLKVIHWFAEADVLFIEHIPMSLTEVFAILVIVYMLRFVIVRPNLKNSVRFVMCFFIFLMIKTGYQIYENKKNEILFLNLGKTKVFLMKKGDKASFWISDIKASEKVVKFVISPYCSSRRIRHFDIKTFPSSAQKVVFKDKIYELK